MFRACRHSIVLICLLFVYYIKLLLFLFGIKLETLTYLDALVGCDINVCAKLEELELDKLTMN